MMCCRIPAREERSRLYSGLGGDGGIVLLLAMAILIVRHRLTVSKHLLAEQQVKQLGKEKQLTTMQAVLDGETAERSRLAKDLHDGLGSMLSVVKLNLPEMKSGAVWITKICIASTTPSACSMTPSGNYAGWLHT